MKVRKASEIADSWRLQILRDCRFPENADSLRLQMPGGCRILEICRFLEIADS